MPGWVFWAGPGAAGPGGAAGANYGEGVVRVVEAGVLEDAVGRGVVD